MGSREKIDKLLKKAIKGVDFITEKERDVINWSPTLDDLVGDGILSGSFVLMSGNYKTGKTSACMHFAKRAQERGYKIVFVNVENRLSERDLRSTEGLDLSPEKFELITSSEGTILSGEDFCGLTTHKITNEQKIVVIFDSLSQLCSSELHEGDMRDRFRDSTPLLLSRFCKLIAAPIKLNNNIFMGITHQIVNQSPGAHGGMMATSGRKIQYAADYSIKATFSKPWLEDKIPVGQDIMWKCGFSATGPPGRDGIGKLRYNHGLDEIAEILYVANTLMSLKPSGSGWYTIYDKKIQGDANTLSYLKDNPEILKKLKGDLAIRLVEPKK